jgi:prevent-host-death family protein
MQVSIAEAETRLAELIQAAKAGDQVVITQDGEPVAEIKAAEPQPKKRNPQFGTMRDQIKLNPGWDDPITEEQFLSGDF